MLNIMEVDKDLLKQKYNTKIVKNQEQLSRDFKNKWKEQENEFEVGIMYLQYFYYYLNINIYNLTNKFEKIFIV